jgi:hypothetical protein
VSSVAYSLLEFAAIGVDPVTLTTAETNAAASAVTATAQAGIATTKAAEAAASAAIAAAVPRAPKFIAHFGSLIGIANGASVAISGPSLGLIAATKSATGIFSFTHATPASGQQAIYSVSMIGGTEILGRVQLDPVVGGATIKILRYDSGVASPVLWDTPEIQVVGYWDFV